tara:strand:- start:7853 stop:9295 length:1443 start_codon:yes stop_codon:yes gene_type:complete
MTKSKKFLFTAESIKALPLAEPGSTKPLIFSDTRTVGLQVDCKPPRKGHAKASRKVFFYRRVVGYDDKGNPIRPRQKLGTAHELTIAQARRRVDMVIREDSITGEIKNRRTANIDYNVKQMIDDYLTDKGPNSKDDCKKLRKGTWSNSESAARNYIVPFFGTWAPTDITNLDIQLWNDALISRGVGQISRQKALSVLRQAFKHNRKRYRIDPNSSFPDYVIELNLKPRSSKFGASEFFRLWDFLPIGKQWINTSDEKAREIQRAIRLLMLTGVRKMEILDARWEDMVPLFNGRIPALRVPAARQKKDRDFIIPLSPIAEKILEEQFWASKRPTDRTQNIFQHINTQMGLNNAMKVQGKFKETPHDIRRTVATAWGALGFPKDLIKWSLGHKPQGVTEEVYNQYQYLPERHEMISRWATILLDSINTYNPSSQGGMWGTHDDLVGNLNVKIKSRITIDDSSAGIEPVGHLPVDHLKIGEGG